MKQRPKLRSLSFSDLPFTPSDHHRSPFGMLSGGDEWGNDGGARMVVFERDDKSCWWQGRVAGRGREWPMGWWQTGRMAGAGS
ncbi:hypothetical protein GOBAR_DD15914 [Gossypium barbadense]|nr:hypothetical protein GOBAR_DD15914 [Gossypium barbadense]